MYGLISVFPVSPSDTTNGYSSDEEDIGLIDHDAEDRVCRLSKNYQLNAKHSTTTVIDHSHKIKVKLIIIQRRLSI